MSFDLLELREKADIAIKKQPQIIHAIAQHGQAVWPHAKREADVFLRVQAHVANHVGVHLTRAGHFKPFASQRPALELQVNLGAGLGKREEAGAETQHQVVGFKKSTAEIGDDKLEVFETHVFANPQALALVEHGGVRGVAVDAVGAARRDDADLRHGA